MERLLAFTEATGQEITIMESRAGTIILTVVGSQAIYFDNRAQLLRFCTRLAHSLAVEADYECSIADFRATLDDDFLSLVQERGTRVSVLIGHDGAHAIAALGAPRIALTAPMTRRTLTESLGTPRALALSI